MEETLNMWTVDVDKYCHASCQRLTKVIAAQHGSSTCQQLASARMAAQPVNGWRWQIWPPNLLTVALRVEKPYLFIIDLDTYGLPTCQLLTLAGMAQQPFEKNGRRMSHKRRCGMAQYISNGWLIDGSRTCKRLILAIWLPYLSTVYERPTQVKRSQKVNWVKYGYGLST